MPWIEARRFLKKTPRQWSGSNPQTPPPEPDLCENDEDLSQEGQEIVSIEPKTDEDLSKEKAKWCDSSSGSSTSKLLLKAIDATSAQCFMFWCNNLKIEGGLAVQTFGRGVKRQAKSVRNPTKVKHAKVQVDLCEALEALAIGNVPTTTSKPTPIDMVSLALSLESLKLCVC